MDKYIKQESAINACYDGFADCRDDCAANIKNLPAEDVAPVRHGRWIKMTGMMPPEYCGHYECSLCEWHGKYNIREQNYSYCPNCGARMDGV